MAVEIPVVIDIEGAFQDAAKRVKPAMTPLQEMVDKNALYVGVKISPKSTKLLKDLFGETFEESRVSMKQFEYALGDIEARINRLASKGGFNLMKGLSFEEKSLLGAATLLERKVKGVGDTSTATARIFQMNMQQAEEAIAKYTAKLDQLQIKQNKSRKRNADGGLSSALPYQKQIDAVNLKLSETRAFLNACTVELNKITASGNAASAAVGRMVTPAQATVAIWEKGHAALANYNSSLYLASGRMGMLLKSGLQLIGLHAAFNFVRNIRQVTSEFELQRVALGGIIQDTQRAEELFRQIKAAAIKSPFEIKDLISFTKQLSAYRIETDKLFDVTMRLADVSAGLGVDMSRLVLAYGQVRAASVLRGQEVRQFTEAGIPIIEKLAEKFREMGREGTTTADVFKLISARAVPFRMIEEIFNDMTSAGGEFYKMQEKQSETLKGKWMKLKDAASIMYDEIGRTEAVHGAMEGLMDTFLKMLQGWRNTGKVLGIAITGMIAYKVAMANAAIAANALTLREAASISALELNTVAESKLIAAIWGEEKARAVQIKLGNRVVRLRRREAAATNIVSKAYYKLLVALTKNPYAMQIALIAGLVSGLLTLINVARKAAISLDSFEKSIDAFSRASEKAKDNQALIDLYDELSNKTERTASEQAKLARASRELAEIYPAMVTGIDEETEAININTDAIKKNNGEKETARKRGLEAEIKEAKKEIERLKALQKEIEQTINKTPTGTESYFPAMPGTAYTRDYTPTERQTAKLSQSLTKTDDDIAHWTKLLIKAERALNGFSETAGETSEEFDGIEWKKTLAEMAKTEYEGKKVLDLTDDQIEAYGSLEDALEDLAKRWKDANNASEQYAKSLQTSGVLSEAAREELESMKGVSDMTKAVIEAFLMLYNAMGLTKKNGGRGKGYTEDPFIQLMKNRMSYMKDFKKGYEDLSKLMSKDDALARQAEIMKTRGLSLGIDVSEQGESVKNLSKWYEKAMKDAFAKAGKYGAGTDMDAFLARQIDDSSEKGKALKAFQQLIQSLFDAKTDLDTSTLEENLKKALDKTSEKMKQSAQARSFFNDILASTGSEEIATTVTMSVYGQEGDDLKKRVQDEMLSALDAAAKATEDVPAILSKGDYDFFKPLVENFDINEIRKNFDKLPQALQPTFQKLIDEQESFDADWFKNFYQTFSKTRDYAERIDTLNAQRVQKKKEATEQGVDEAGMKAIDDWYNQEVAKVRAEELKDSDEWIKSFEDLDKVGSRTLRSLIARISEFIKLSGNDLPANQLREIVKNLEQVEGTLSKRDPYKTAISGVKDYIAALKALRDARKLDKDDPNKETALKNAENARAKALYKIGEAMQGINDQLTTMSSALSSVTELLDLDELSDTKAILDGLASGIALVGTALTLVNAILSMMNTNPLVLAISAVIAAIASVVKVIENLRVAKLNRELKEQDKILNDLERSYKRLGDAIQDAFGSEYIALYQQQLAVLEAESESIKAKIEALQEAKAAAKNTKQEEEYEEQIKDLESELGDTEQKIKDLNKDFQSFFAGSDITSAAKDFAQAWLDAYKSFGSTTAAMKEKFRDMIDNMVVSSLAARIVEGALEPVFNELAKWADEEGKISEEGIASVADVAADQIDVINNQLGGVMEKLAGLGINMRGTGSTLTGISKDIAGASEESILGLAAGINTQNYYMSYMPTISQNVATIVTLLGGENAVSQPGTTLPETSAFGDELFRGQMNRIDENIAILVDLVRSVRSVKQSSTNTHVIAVANQ